MHVFRSFVDFNKFSSKIADQGLSLGFVPTMGALHQGHISLLERARAQNDYTLVSVFVNPAQFNESADFEKYPRAEDADMQLLREAGADAVYLPNHTDIYPSNEARSPLHFDFAGLDQVMEGACRPGHFDGVVRVLRVFFKQVAPTRAYFGEKDFQQLVIVRRLASLEFEKIEIVAVATNRETSGLARSSRNKRLTPAGLQQASALFKALHIAASKSASFDAQTITLEAEEFLRIQPGLTLEYFNIVDEANLQSVEGVIGPNCRAFVAARCEDVRLIDNMPLYAARNL